MDNKKKNSLTLLVKYTEMIHADFSYLSKY